MKRISKNCKENINSRFLAASILLMFFLILFPAELSAQTDIIPTDVPALKNVIAKDFYSGYNSRKNDVAAPTGEQTSKLAEILDSLRYEFDLPALGAAVITTTNILDAQAVGCRRYGGEQNITNNDQFHIGSNLKAMTSALMGIFVDEGKIDWSTTLKDIFPELEGNMRNEYRDVTVRDLLAHCGGFVRESGIFPGPGTPKEKRFEVVKWAVRQPPATRRGVHLYSNVGYIIAGAIIEKIAGGQYEELLIERILSPLGVTTAGFGAMGTPGMEDQPLQHRINSSGQVIVTYAGPSSDNPEIYSPAGRLHLSVGDWAKYIQFVLKAETGNSGLLTAQTAAELTSRVVRIGGETYYGYGWVNFETEWGGGKTLFHNGSNGKNYSEAWLAPDKNFAVIVVTNQYGGNTDTYISAVVERLIDFYFENFYPTSVGNSNMQNVPSEAALSQNYPNPFNPETNICYRIQIPGYITLKIYDVVGREVATLVDEYKQPGVYGFQISTNDFKMTSGVYFYKLSTDDYSQTKKMILLK